MMWFLPCLLAAVLVAVLDAKPFELPPLPYGYDALEPVIGKRTLEIHHDKHHAKYVNTMNTMIEGTNQENQSLESIIKSSYGTDQGLFNNAAQSWNHAFYWNCMSSPKSSTKNGGKEPPSGKLKDMIDASFGSFAEFRKQFAAAGNTAFGSGWAWLVYDGKGLVVTKTIGADNPMTTPEHTPILTMDVWEHAYYLDYQNMRATYVDNFLDKLVNWKFVEDNLMRAMAYSKEEL